MTIIPHPFRNCLVLATAGLLTAAVDGAVDDRVRLTLVPTGGSAKAGYYAPQRTNMSPTAPEGVSKAPADLVAPSYGTLPIGEAGVLFILDEPESGKARLFVDTNRNGDLTDDPATEWEGREGKPDAKGGGKTFTTWNGSAMVTLLGAPGAATIPVGIRLYRFDKTDPGRAGLKDVLLFYRDYACEGEVTLAGRTMRALLLDERAAGSFAPAAPTADPSPDSGVKLLLDVNANGRFDSRGESFDVTKPFNLGGTTYEIAEMARDGTSFRVVASKKSVAEIPTPPDLSVGKVMESFTAVDTAGRPVNFPGDYKGKVVLVDFWATWCGPCMAEMPHVVKAYEACHARGFEVLGISLDNDKSIAKMPAVMEKAKMTWRQIADGKGWGAEIAQKFAINSIPATMLVDGTTGRILGTDIPGEELEKAVERALAEAKAK